MAYNRVPKNFLHFHMKKCAFSETMISNRNDMILTVSQESYKNMSINHHLKVFLKQTEILFCKKCPTENQLDVRVQFRKISNCLVLNTNRSIGNQNLTTPICLSNDIKIRVNAAHSLPTYKLFSVGVYFGEAVTAFRFASYVVNSDEKKMTAVDDNRFYQQDNTDTEKIRERNSY